MKPFRITSLLLAVLLIVIGSSQTAFASTVVDPDLPCTSLTYDMSLSSTKSSATNIQVDEQSTDANTDGEVSKLQHVVATLEDMSVSGGIYDEKTVAGVKILQKDEGLAQTGVVDAALRQAIQRDTCDTSSSSGRYVYSPSLNTTNIIGGATGSAVHTSGNSANGVQTSNTVANTAANLVTTNLSYGMRDSSTNGQVTNLQQFLNNSGFLTVSPTGYFGSQTRLAVMAYQRSKGLPAVGNVGPRTRAAIKVDLTSTTGSIITTFPASGRAPLSVQFFVTTDASMPVLDFGDSNTTTGGGSACNRSCSLTHTYTTPGTYTAQLIVLRTCTASSENPFPSCPPQVLASKTITVSASSSTRMCSYPQPPTGCHYVAGPEFVSSTSCGLVLSCSVQSQSDSIR